MINNDAIVVRADTTLTGSYVAGTVVNSIDASQINVLVDWTKGDETSIEVKFEFSPDAETTWYQEVSESISGTTATASLLEHSMSDDGNYMFELPVSANDFRVSIKATGGTPDGTAAISVQEANI